MPDEAGQDRLAQFEQAVTTLITCRSVVRHFTILGEAQQKELLTEIDATLQFLRASLLACTVGTPNQSTVPEPQQPESGALIVREEGKEHAHTEQYTLKTLYKMYHTFLSDGRSDTISSFAARFSEAMSLLSDAEGTMTMAPAGSAFAYPYPAAVQDSLDRVRSFIVDLYYMLLEFMRAVSGVLQAHEIHIDTEELYPFPEHPTTQAGEHTGPDLRPLAGVYEKHQQINERRGALSCRISNATVLLEFLEEQISASRSRSDETIRQLNETAQLLRDLACLLSGYESATLLLLRRIR
ncbi:MAG TPA: hypothetical protein VKV37_03070 [Ktedonobacteraceae bacterium]|nr:hypothetical protein [Ktedonobacteraceae bacterium]